MGTTFAVVSSGGAVSGNIDLTKEKLVGLLVPTVTSADLILQGNVDTTSGTFYRMVDVRASGGGDLRLPTSVGSRMVMLPEDFVSPPHARLEFSVAQTSTRTLTLLTRPRR